MNKSLKVSKSIIINAKAEDVWDALTNPEKIKVYLYGTETTTDWKVGSPIFFQGEYEGHQYKDKGYVLENQHLRLIQYNYWSGFSGIVDLPENYSTITYQIENVGNQQVKFSWTQEGFANEQGHQHAESGLYSMLEQIKALVENV